MILLEKSPPPFSQSANDQKWNAMESTNSSIIYDLKLTLSTHAHQCEHKHARRVIHKHVSMIQLIDMWYSNMKMSNATHKTTKPPSQNDEKWRFNSYITRSTKSKTPKRLKPFWLQQFQVARINKPITVKQHFHYPQWSLYVWQRTEVH